MSSENEGKKKSDRDYYFDAYDEIQNQPIDHGHYENVYQFKIVLQDVKPNIWRRILVPENFDFRELHLAINHSMGWFNTHMHQFRIKNPDTGEKETIGKLEEEFVPDVCSRERFKPSDIPETNTKISDYFKTPNYKALYEYDFGNQWEHVIVFEQILPRDPNTTYPKCIDGKRACAIENTGGPIGYKRMLEILSNPNHPEYKNQKKNLSINGGVEAKDFNPNEFDIESIDFYDSDKQKELCHGTGMCQRGCPIM